MFRSLIACVAITGFGFSAQADSLELLVQGSNTIGASLGPALAEAWLPGAGYQVDQIDRKGEETRMQASGNAGGSLTVLFKSYGSSTGFRALQAQDASLAMSSRLVKDSEVRALASVGDLRALENEYVIAMDGIAVLVHSDNPINALSKHEIRDIFSGKLTDWAELGGKTGNIVLHARDDASGTYDVFKLLVLDKEHPLAGGTKRYEDNALLADAVAADPHAIGFAGLAYVRSAKVLAISDGSAPAITPSLFSVATEDYALSRRLYFYLPGTNAGKEARALAEFAVSEHAQPIIDNSGFVSHQVRASKASPGEQYPDRFLQLVDGAQHAVGEYSLRGQIHRTRQQGEARRRPGARLARRQRQTRQRSDAVRFRRKGCGVADDDAGTVEPALPASRQVPA